MWPGGDAPHVIHRVKLCLHAKFYACSFFFLVKHQFWLICLVHKGVCHIDLLKKIPLVTLILNIWVHGSIFNPLSMNH